jgi:hypothetical protein
MELYGGFITFGPEWIEGSPNLDSSHPISFWVYLVFMVSICVLLFHTDACRIWSGSSFLFIFSTSLRSRSLQLVTRCADACHRCRHAVQAQTESQPAATSSAWYLLSTTTLVVYGILIPLILWNLYTVGSLTNAGF